MKIQDQVCDFGLAKRLKKLGVKQDSEFFWTKQNYKTFVTQKDFIKISYKGENFSAFTVAELGEKFPRTSWTQKIYSTAPDPNSCYWMACENGDFMFKDGIYIIAEKEADTRAKMLIYLIEKGIVKP